MFTGFCENVKLDTVVLNRLVMTDNETDFVAEVYKRFNKFWTYSERLILIVICPFIILLPTFIFLGLIIVLVAYIPLGRLWLSGTPREQQNRTILTGACRFLKIFATVLNGYEVSGLDNIPDEGGALLISYHGTFPMDYIYMVGQCLFKKKRLMRAIADRSTFKIPVMKGIIECAGMHCGTVDDCAEILRCGELLCIYPGGLRESFFGDENYQVMWGKRVGFARSAIKAGVPIIPMFTENCREFIWTTGFFRWLLTGLFDKYKCAVVPAFGGLPVKMKTWIGEPINFDPDYITPEELVLKTKEAVELLITKHQRVPGSIVSALADRFRDSD